MATGQHALEQLTCEADMPHTVRSGTFVPYPELGFMTGNSGVY